MQHSPPVAETGRSAGNVVGEAASVARHKKRAGGIRAGEKAAYAATPWRRGGCRQNVLEAISGGVFSQDATIQELVKHRGSSDGP